MQCTLKPVSASDYAGYAALNSSWTGTARSADLSALGAAFPGGVCDYSKPGLQEQPLLGTWIQVTGPAQIKALHPLNP